MNTTLLLTVLSLTMFGCSASTLVTPSGKPGDMSYAQFNGQIGNNEANIDFRNGTTVTGQEIYITKDSIVWVDPETHLQRSSAIASVRHIGRFDRTLSTLVGLGIGAAVGVGVALSGTSGPHNGGGEGYYWLIAPPSGALIGAGIGALIGWPSGYEFDNGPASAVPGSKK